MSRIGKLPVSLPKGVKASIQGQTLLLEGPKGKLSKTFPAAITISVENENIIVKRSSDEGPVRALHGTVRAHVNNMVKGTSQGFSKTLIMIGVGYRAAAQGNKINLSVGFSHPVVFELPQGVTGSVADQTKITLNSCDRELLGAVADRIRAVKPPEPYKGKGIRYDGEVVQLKAGKAAASGGK